MHVGMKGRMRKVAAAHFHHVERVGFGQLAFWPFQPGEDVTGDQPILDGIPDMVRRLPLMRRDGPDAQPRLSEGNRPPCRRPAQNRNGVTRGTAALVGRVIAVLHMLR